MTAGAESGFEKGRAVRATRCMDTCRRADTPRDVAQQNRRRTPSSKHHNPESLAGGPYGNPTIHMRRQTMPPDSEAGPREEPTRMQSQYPKPAVVDSRLGNTPCATCRHRARAGRGFRTLCAPRRNPRNRDLIAGSSCATACVTLAWDKDPSEGLLLKQEPTTRPDVPLVPTAPRCRSSQARPGQRNQGVFPPRASPSAQPPPPAIIPPTAESWRIPLKGRMRAQPASWRPATPRPTVASRFRRLQPTRSGCGTG